LTKINDDKTKYMVIYRDQIAGCHNIRIDDKSLERVEQFDYLI